VVAYELLFRGSWDAVEAGRFDTYATSHVIVNAFTEFGIGEVAGDRPCFINLTHEFLVGELTLPFGPEQVVLEVLETVAVDDEVIAGITALVEAGYRIALDDFVWGSGHERLLPVASYVKPDRDRRRGKAGRPVHGRDALVDPSGPGHLEPGGGLKKPGGV
jgi:c-di-GMP-related signal transduction protein